MKINIFVTFKLLMYKLCLKNMYLLVGSAMGKTTSPTTTSAAHPTTLKSSSTRIISTTTTITTTTTNTTTTRCPKIKSASRKHLKLAVSCFQISTVRRF